MANDAAAEKLERMMRYLVGAEERLAYRTAIAALRTAPPAPGNGAAAMRETARAVLADLLFQLKHGSHSHAALVERFEMGIAALDLPLPAPEVPDRLTAFATDVRRIAAERVAFYVKEDMPAAAHGWQEIVTYCEGALKP